MAPSNFRDFTSNTDMGIRYTRDEYGNLRDTDGNLIISSFDDYGDRRPPTVTKELVDKQRAQDPDQMEFKWSDDSIKSIYDDLVEVSRKKLDEISPPGEPKTIEHLIKALSIELDCDDLPF